MSQAENYYTAILTREVEALAGMGENTGRDCALFDAARRLCRHVLAGGLDLADVEEELVWACTQNGLTREKPENKVRETVHRALDAARRATPARVPTEGQKTRQEGNKGHQGQGRGPLSPAMQTPSAADMRREIKYPSPAWIRQAEKFWRELTFNGLAQPERDECTRLLAARGLTPEAAYTRHGIKYLPEDKNLSRAPWGLADRPEKLAQRGKDSLYMPRGLIMACYDAGHIIGFEVRCANYGLDKPLRGYAKTYKIHNVEGGMTPLTFVRGEVGQPCILCESGLDAALMYDLTEGQWACVGAQGGKVVAGGWYEYLCEAPRLVYVRDSDSAGDTNAKKIRKSFPHASIVPPPGGYKDPTSVTACMDPQAGRRVLQLWLEEQKMLDSQKKAIIAPVTDFCPAHDKTHTATPENAKQGQMRDMWDHEDGRPLCYLVSWYRSQNPKLAPYMKDLQGYGIPSQGVPLVLRGFAKNGWRVEVDPLGELFLVKGKGGRGQENEEGNLAYMRAHAQKIRETIVQWAAFEEAYPWK